jgi:glycosyltransferase involved in cell wall biosynthesis
MRILYCNKYNFAFSGTEVYLFELMEMMRSHGHQTTLFSMADTRGHSSKYAECLLPKVDFKGPEKNLWQRARLAAHAIYSREARRRMRRMIQKFRPDLAHVRNIYHHLSPSILWELKAQGVPVVYHLNDFKLVCPSYNCVSDGRVCERCRGGQFWRVVSEGCYAGTRGSAAVLAAEAYVHKWLNTYRKCVTRFLAPSEFVRGRLIANGWDAEKIDVLAHFQCLPADLPGPAAPDAPVLYFGRLSAEKGLKDLLRAISHLPQISLWIAGDGPQREELHELAQNLKLENLQFLGHLHGERLQNHIAQSRFTILPSRAYETLGKTILESYAMNRAVVASDLGSRRELVIDGQTGLLFPPGDVERLAGAISFLYQRPELAAKMGEAGRDLVRHKHSPESHYVQMMLLYEGLAANKEAGHSTQTRSPKPQIRVAFIGGRGVISKYSGIESYYEQVGKRLAAMGHEVTIYCRSYFTPQQEEYNGMKLVRLPTIHSKHFETVIHTFLSTMHVLFSRCDIVHYHALGPALFSFIPRLAGKKTAVTVQGLDWQRKKWGCSAAHVLRLGEKAAVRLPNLTVVVSRTLQDYYRAFHLAETLYVPNGTEVRGLRAPEHLREWGLEPDNYILFLGRFSPEKNCHLLIEAYEQIDTRVKLVLAGGSSYTDVYAYNLCKHASDRIRLFGWMSGAALDELLTNAMLFVLPSDVEGLSLALLDAMGAGLCVLASDIPENRELVESAGFTFRRSDVRDLERMIRLLISDPEIRARSGRKAQEKIRQEYSWPQITHDIEQAYLRLMGWQEVPIAGSARKPVGHEDSLKAVRHKGDITHVA